MVPIGGIFLIAVGIAMIVGAALPRWRKQATAGGMMFGAGAAFLAFPYLVSPPPPTALQIGSLALAVLLEVVAFISLMPALHRISEKAVAAGTLAIVGAHFAFMLPALGWWIGLLAVLCVFNATWLWLAPRYSIRTAWAADGALKLIIGSIMYVQPSLPNQLP